MQTCANGQRNMQLMGRAIANGVISERDRLFQFSVGEFYEEMSLYIEEQEIQKAELDKLKEK